MDIVIWFLFIGLLAGWIAGLIMQGEGFGCLGNMIVGVLGAMVGGYVFHLFNVPPGTGFWGSLGTALLGAIVFLYLVRVIKRI